MRHLTKVEASKLNHRVPRRLGAIDNTKHPREWRELQVIRLISLHHLKTSKLSEDRQLTDAWYRLSKTHLYLPTSRHHVSWQTIRLTWTRQYGWRVMSFPWIS